MRINIDLLDLEIFLAVAELGSFLRAAEKLNLSQSAVTRRIQKLENTLSVTLFERTTRSLKLTLAAKQFQERAHSILSEADEALHALRDETSHYEHQKQSIITMAVIPTIAHQILPEAIRRFRQEGYTSRLNILDLFADQVIEAVINGDADFGVSFVGLNEPGLLFDKIIDDQFVLAMRKNHALAGKKSIRWADLANEDLIVPWKGTGNRLLIDNAMARSRIRLNWSCQVKHSSTAIGLVESGIGTAVLPSAMLLLNANQAITTRPLVNPKIIRVLSTVRRSSIQLAPAARRMFQLLSQANG